MVDKSSELKATDHKVVDNLGEHSVARNKNPDAPEKFKSEVNILDKRVRDLSDEEIEEIRTKGLLRERTYSALVTKVHNKSVILADKIRDLAPKFDKETVVEADRKNFLNLLDGIAKEVEALCADANNPVPR